MTGVYELYGIRVRSAVALPAPAVGDASCASDVETRWVYGNSAGCPTERVLAETGPHDGRGHRVTRTESGYRLCFYQTADWSGSRGPATIDFEIAEDFRTIQVVLPPGADCGLAVVLLSGSVLAWLLRLRGDCVLHASAVAIGDRALAIAGASGVGKSTVAAMLCAEGAGFVTDDVLRIDASDRQFTCASGTAQLRLRGHAGELAARCAAAARSSTADGRIGLTLGRCQRNVRLHAIVIPRRSRGDVVKVERLSSTSALIALMAHGGPPGRLDTGLLGHQLRRFARLAGGVPIYDAEIPWRSRGWATAPALAEAIGLPICEAPDVRSQLPN